MSELHLIFSPNRCTVLSMLAPIYLHVAVQASANLAFDLPFDNKPDQCIVKASAVMAVVHTLYVSSSLLSSPRPQFLGPEVCLFVAKYFSRTQAQCKRSTEGRSPQRVTDISKPKISTGQTRLSASGTTNSFLEQQLSSSTYFAGRLSENPLQTALLSPHSQFKAVPRPLSLFKGMPATTPQELRKHESVYNPKSY